LRCQHVHIKSFPTRRSSDINGKIIQELEAVFQGAGWNVIKVIWGSDWDNLLAADKTGLLLKRMEEAVDGDYQKYSVEPGSYTRIDRKSTRLNSSQQIISYAD